MRRAVGSIASGAVVAALLGAAVSVAEEVDLRARSAALEARLERSPSDRGLRLGLAKMLHFRGVAGDEAAAARALAMLEALAGEAPDEARTLAYLGSATLWAANLAWAPWRKGELALEGLQTMDRAVALAGSDAEVRFLRGVSTRPLPRIAGRADLAADDLAIAARGAEAAVAAGTLEPWIGAAALFHHAESRLDRGDRAGARAAWRKAAALAPTSPAGRDAAARLADVE